MPSSEKLSKIEFDHQPENIRERLQRRRDYNYLGDIVLGAIDGCVTTFAVIAGAIGAGFSSGIAIVMGFANLVADGFSMAVSNYHNTRSQRELVEKARQREFRHIEIIPEGEREEIRQIFSAKGFESEILENIVEVITRNRDLWVDTMIKEELGLQSDGPQPFLAALATLIAFILIGSIPLMPFLITSIDPSESFMVSVLVTGVVFFMIGMVKGHVIEKSRVFSGIETLMTGGGAALLAYLVGNWLRASYGVL